MENIYIQVKHKFRLKAILIACIMLFFSQVCFSQAALPASHSGLWGEVSLPTGWTSNSVTNYNNSGDDIAIFNAGGDWLKIYFDCIPDEISYDFLKDAGSGREMVVEESSDDASYTTVATINETTANGSYNYSLSTDTRYVRFRMVSKTSGVFSQDDISITKAACSAPTAHATSLVFSGVTCNSTDGSFTAASPTADGYLIIRYESTSGWTPTDAATYSDDQNVSGDCYVVTMTQTLRSQNQVFLPAPPITTKCTHTIHPAVLAVLHTTPAEHRFQAHRLPLLLHPK